MGLLRVAVVVRTGYRLANALQKGNPDVAIFSIEVGGLPVMAFNAASQAEADAFGQDPDLRADLQVLEGPEGPLWDGEAPIVTRPALPDEESLWEKTVAEEREAGEIEDEEDTFAVYLLPVTDPEGDYEDEDEEEEEL